MTDKAEARPGSLEPLADASMTWRYRAPPGHTLEMCQRPDYWRNNVREAGRTRSAGVTPWNRIEIIAEDGTWEAEFRVLSAADGLVVTRLIREWHVAAKPGRKPSVPDDYRIEHVRDNGWRAIDPHGEPVAQRLATEEMAVRAAADHARKAKGGE